VVDLREEGASLDFLGYTFRYDRDLKGRDRKYLNVIPSKKPSGGSGKSCANDEPSSVRQAHPGSD